MLTEQRQQFILQLLKERGFIRLHDVIDLTNASESTVRRDFVQLEKEKKLKRVHGGAALVQSMSEESDYEEKIQTNIGSKVQIAKYAASLIEDGDCVYLDAGSSTFEMIPYITATNLTVVTNGLMHIDPLLKHGINVYVIGGSVKAKTRAMIGKTALQALQTYQFNKCFLGANGVHPQFGYTTPDPEEGVVKKVASMQSIQTCVLVDGTKIDEVTFSQFLEIGEGVLITNESDEGRLKAYRQQTDVKVVTA